MSRENDWVYHFRDRQTSDPVAARLVTAILDQRPVTITIATRADRKNFAVQAIPKNVRVTALGVSDLKISTNHKAIEILHFDHLSVRIHFVSLSLPYTSIILRLNLMSSVFIYNFISLLQKDLRRAGLAAFFLYPYVQSAYEKTPAFAGANPLVSDLD